jgi:hypothetical protein
MEQKEGLEVYFDSMFSRFLAHLHEHQVLTTESARMVNLVLNIPLAMQMKFMAELKECMVPKAEQDDPQKILAACDAILTKIIQTYPMPDPQKAKDTLVRFAACDYEVIKTSYRYMECCHRIACAHQKILIEYVQGRR